MAHETWSIGNIKETPLNPHSLAIWPDGVGVGDVASPICIVSPLAGLDDTDIKNARLIAAAPDLLAALEDIAEGVGRFSKDPLTHAENCIEDMKAIARAAIAKATKTGPLENY